MKKANQSLVDVNDDFFGTILVCAVRYSLGRMSYMPRLVQDFIRQLLPHISLKSLAVMARDIREWGGEEHDIKAYGMDFDYRNWMIFLADCDAEIARRKNNESI